MNRAYPTRPVIGIGICLLRQDDVLLIRRSRPPSAGQWALPGGAQQLGETAEEAARRELLEETGTMAGPLHLAAVVDSLHRDAAGILQYHYTIIDFAGNWQAGEARAASDAAALAWVAPESLPAYGLWEEALRVIDTARTLLAPVRN